MKKIAEMEQETTVIFIFDLCRIPILFQSIEWKNFYANKEYKHLNYSFDSFHTIFFLFIYCFASFFLSDFYNSANRIVERRLHKAKWIKQKNIRDEKNYFRSKSKMQIEFGATQQFVCCVVFIFPWKHVISSMGCDICSSFLRLFCSLCLYLCQCTCYF